MDPSLGALAAMAFSAFTGATLWPVGSELVFVGLLAKSDVAPLALFLVATLANVAGSTLNWVLGLAMARTVDGEKGHALLARFRLSDQRRIQAEQAFQRYGAWVLLMSWLPIIGDPLTVVAGMARYPLVRFLIFVAIGKAVRYAALWAGWRGFEYLI